MNYVYQRHLYQYNFSEAERMPRRKGSSSLAVPRYVFLTNYGAAVIVVHNSCFTHVEFCLLLKLA